jgi:DNA-binding beta-propeller fold protein YncE
MNDLVVVEKIAQWQRLKTLVLDSVSSPITKRVYNVALDEFYRAFSGCNNASVVVDPSTGKVVATIKNGTHVDGLGWDSSNKLIYIPNGAEGNVTIVHQDSPNQYTTVASVDTFTGAKTIAVDPATHNAYLFQPERGPTPVPLAGGPTPAADGPGRGPLAPIVAAWFIVIKQ